MNAPTATATLMSGAEYRDSLRRLRPTVFVDGRRVDSVADEPSLAPGVNAIALTYDWALKPEYEPLMTAVQHTSGKRVNRLSHIDTSPADLLNKLEAVRMLCQQTGCAQRYLTHDALNALGQVSARIDDARGTRENTARFQEYLHRIQDQDLTVAVAMTDAKGDRSLRPHQQANVDSYVHVVERNARGIVISGTKAIVTGAPYVHEILVMPCRNMGQEDADFAVCCAVPVDRETRSSMEKRSFRASTGKAPPCASSTGCSCRGRASSTRASGNTAVTSPTAMPRTTGRPASPPVPASETS
jgi:4-hydroxybutyryl-CoA dehydratase / vinylacetyl-CoA-Delta-isomerase